MSALLSSKERAERLRFVSRALFNTAQMVGAVGREANAMVLEGQPPAVIEAFHNGRLATLEGVVAHALQEAGAIDWRHQLQIFPGNPHVHRGVRVVPVQYLLPTDETGDYPGEAFVVGPVQPNVFPVTGIDPLHSPIAWDGLFLDGDVVCLSQARQSGNNKSLIIHVPADGSPYLGNELNNGDFKYAGSEDTGALFWDATDGAAWILRDADTGKGMLIQGNGGSGEYAGFTQSNNKKFITDGFVDGQWYLVEVFISEYTDGEIFIIFGNNHKNPGVKIASAGYHRFFMKFNTGGGDAGFEFRVEKGSDTEMYIGSVSIERLAGFVGLGLVADDNDPNMVITLSERVPAEPEE